MELTGKEKARNKGVEAENKYFENNNFILPEGIKMTSTKSSDFMDMYMGIDTEVIYYPGKNCIKPIFFTGDIKSTSRLPKFPEDIYINNENYRETRYMLIAYQDAQKSMMPSTFFKTEADYFIVWLQYYNINPRTKQNDLYNGWYFYKYDVMANLCLYGTPDKPLFQSKDKEEDYIIKRLESLNTEPKTNDIWLREGFYRNEPGKEKQTSKLFAVPVDLFFDYWTFVNRCPTYSYLHSTSRERFMHENKYYRRGEDYNNDLYIKYTDILDKNF